MAQYDGSIRINTKIDTKNASGQLMSLENRIVKTADKIASLRSKMDAMKDVRFSTQAYKDLEKELASAEKELAKMAAQDNKIEDLGTKINKLAQSSAELASKMNGVEFAKDISKEYERINRSVEQTKFLMESFVDRNKELSELGKTNSSEYQENARKIEELKNTLSLAESEMKRLVESGKAFTIDTENKGYKKIAEKYESVNQELERAKLQQEELIGKQADSVERVEEIKAQMQQLVEEGRAFQLGSETQEYSNLGQQLEYAENDLVALTRRHDELIERQSRTANGYKELKNAIKKFGALGKSVLSLMQKFVKKIESGFKKLGETAKKSFTKVNKSASGTNNIFQTGLKNILKYGLGIRSLYALVNKFRTAVKEGFSNMYNDANMLEFKRTVDNLRASLLTLKNAFAAAFRPIVEIAIPYIQKLTDYMTALLDKLGQFFAAITGQKTYTRAIKQTADAFKEEAKEAKKLEGYLSPLDEINPYSNGKSDKEKDNEEIRAPMFEEVPIDSYFLDLANKVKDIFSQLFAPLKEAWNREGRFVMDSWKYALGEVWDLIKSIESDFLEVWQQEKTIKIFEDLLHIIGDIGLVVGNLAHNFRLAWEENETGKRILEGVRDVIGVIVANIRHAADATVEWSKNLDFSPFLTKMQAWIGSLIPVFDALSGIITDFYEHVLLPLGKWVLEKGLPDLLQVFIDFNNKVDWNALRARLAEFWKHLEPFAETVGQGLIIFIGRLTDALANFINSPAFDKFLTKIENWMDSVKPEDVADALEAIAKGIISLKVGLTAWSVLQAPLKVFASFISLASSVKMATALKNLGMAGAANNMRNIGEAAGGMGSAANGAANAVTSLSEATGGLLGNATMTAGVVATLDSTMQKMSKDRTRDEALNETAEVLGMLKQQVDDGVISLGQFEAERDKLNKILLQTGFKADKESLTELNTALDETVIKFNLTGESMDAFSAKAMETGDNVGAGLTQGLQSVDVETPVQGFFSKMLSYVKSIFGIHSPSTVMAEMGKYIIEGLIEGINSLAGNVQGLWNSMKETAIQTWESIKQSLSEKWENLKTSAKDTFNNIREKIKESWTGIKENVKQSAENVKTNISNAWTKAKESTTAAWNNMKSNVQSSVQSIANSIREKFGNIQNAISSFGSSAQNIWSSAWEGMRNKVTSILSSIQNTISSVFSWISSTIGSLGNSLRSLTSSTFSFGSSKTTITGNTSSRFSRASMPASLYSAPAFAALNNVEIPKLATGAVIPANREFLAVLGDQKRGTNIEAPLDTIKQANRESLLEVLLELGVTGSRGNEKGNTYNIKALAHSKVLFELMIEEGKIQQMATGNNPFLLGTT